MRVFIIGLILAGLSAGCYPPATVPTEPAADPGTLVERVLAGMSEPNAELVVSSLYRPRRYHQEMVQAFVDLRKEIRAFIALFKEVYGAETWMSFQESGIDGLIIRFGGWEDDRTFDFNEELIVWDTPRRAYYNFPNVRTPTLLRRTGSGWLVDTPTLLGSRRETLEVRLWMSYWMEILRQARWSMENEKPKAEELYLRTARQINRELFGRREDRDGD